jgi:hypothetical protein
MSFWVNVGVFYVLILGIGLVVGHYLSSRFPGHGRGRGTDAASPVGPPSPTFGAEWPELGSDFDRAFLPGAFVDAPVASLS